MNMINIKNLTKDCVHGKGVFSTTLSIKQGEVSGYLGPNSAGKSTIMHHLLGFRKARHEAIMMNG